MWTDSQYIRINGIAPQVMKFPGGEIQIRLPNLDYSTSPTVVGRLTSSDAIMELLLINNALHMEQIRYIKYVIPYFPYARQDRVCSGGEAFSLLVIANLLNELDNTITTWDIHSDKIFDLDTPTELINISLAHVFKSAMRVNQWAGKTLVAPDKGALPKVKYIPHLLKSDIDIISFDKVRDPNTGAITGLTLNEEVPTNDSYLIVDDICDGGRTFIEVAKILRDKGAKQIDLYVTHGIFSKGFDVFKGLIDTVYYTNSLHEEITNEIKIIERKINEN